MTSPANTTLAKPEQLRTGDLSVELLTDPSGEPVTALVKQTKAGLVRAMRVRVPLSKERGHVWSMKAWDAEAQTQVTKTAITAGGYDYINQFVGVTLIKPPRVIGDESEERANPYLHREGGEIKYIRISMLGVGRTASGTLTVLHYTLLYDLSTYLAQDLLSKWRGKAKETVKSWGKLVDTDAAQKPEPNWKAYPLPGGVTLHVNLGAKEVVGLISEHISRQKFAERNADTICRRNILKKFIGAAQVDRSMTVSVVSWPQMDRDWTQLLNAAEQASAGEIVVDGVSVTPERTSETLKDKEEIDEALAGEVDEDMVSSEPDEEPPTPGVDAEDPAPQQVEEKSDEDRKRNNWRVACAQCYEALTREAPDAATEVLEKFNMKSIGQLDQLQVNDLGDLLHELRSAIPKRPPAEQPAEQKKATDRTRQKEGEKLFG